MKIILIYSKRASVGCSLQTIRRGRRRREKKRRRKMRKRNE